MRRRVWLHWTGRRAIRNDENAGPWQLNPTKVQASRVRPGGRRATWVCKAATWMQPSECTAERRWLQGDAEGGATQGGCLARQKSKGDVSCLATIPIEREAQAHFLAKEDGVIAGIAMADMIFEEVDPLLKAMVDAARPARILETRKTAPALRLVDKWAVLLGGGENHRMGLFDMVMLKDNHISVAGGVTNAIASVEQYLKENNLQMAVEASGNVTIDTVGKIGTTGVTFISSGALTHSVKALDISLKIDTKLALAVGRRTNRA